MLQKLRDKGNTILVVEHDPDVIAVADVVVDVGPLAGSQGGEIMFTGSLAELKNSDNLTARFLNRDLPTIQTPRISSDFYQITEAKLNNLKNISTKIPKEAFTVITGVAGSGKSSLISANLLKTILRRLLLIKVPYIAPTVPT